MTETITQTSIKCPDWCTGPHGRNELDAGDVVHHVDAATSPWGTIRVEQVGISAGMPVTEPIVIYVPEDPAHGEINAVDARALAAALARAADRLDSINAQVSA